LFGKGRFQLQYDYSRNILIHTLQSNNLFYKFNHLQMVLLLMPNLLAASLSLKFSSFRTNSIISLLIFSNVLFILISPVVNSGFVNFSFVRTLRTVEASM